MIDFCTVVFQEELDVLKLQARSIEQYGDNIGTIRVITNDDSIVDTAWWGKWASHVEVVHRNTFGSNWYNNGWVSQQVLKILGSAQNTNTWTVILDAKTILIKQIDVFDSQGRPQVGWIRIHPVFVDSQQIINQLFDIALKQQLGPGGVPFFINNEQARLMVQDIESRTGTDFAEWFQAQGKVTEFMLYTGYLQSKNLLSTLYNTEDAPLVRPCNICHGEVSMWDWKFDYMEQPKTTTVSVHRNAWTQLTPQQKQQYMDFLQSRGIE
jgi:hypothetical protein